MTRRSGFAFVLLPLLGACAGAPASRDPQPTKPEVRTSNATTPRHTSPAPSALVLPADASLDQLHCSLMATLRATSTDHCLVVVGFSSSTWSQLSITVGSIHLDGHVSCDENEISALVARFGTGVVSGFADRGATQVIHATSGNNGYVQGGVSGGSPNDPGMAATALELAAHTYRDGVTLFAFAFDKAPPCPPPDGT